MPLEVGVVGGGRMALSWDAMRGVSQRVGDNERYHYWQIYYTVINNPKGSALLGVLSLP
jgi:hypothetical protein